MCTLSTKETTYHVYEFGLFQKKMFMNLESIFNIVIQSIFSIIIQH